MFRATEKLSEFLASKENALRAECLPDLRRPVWRGFLLVLLVTTAASSAKAQDAAVYTGKTERNSETPADGKNEFGVWTGYSPFSFKLKGISEDRKLFLVNLQYARKLFVTTPLTLKYTAEIVPVALEMQPRQLYVINDRLVTNPAGTIYGAGANPVGFQGNFGRRRVQPFANGSVGFLYFHQQVPLEGSSRFNYTVTIGVGAQFFQLSGRSFTVGWKYQHLSNNYQAALNPGIDSSMFYVAFSVPRLGHGSH